jgi:hypothetical protein
MSMNRNDDPRHEGYKAGGYFGGRCPYPSGSEEAVAWQLGWVEGSIKRAGARDRHGRASAGWRMILGKLRSLVPTAH